MQIQIPGYDIVSALSEGIWATVFLVSDVASGQERALKVFPRTTRDADETAPWRRLKDFNHPHIVKVVDVGTHGANDYLAMEYLRGSNLNHKRFELDLLARLRVVIGIARALDYLAQQNYIHSALTPENVLLTEPTDKVVLLGFGPSQQAVRHRNREDTDSDEVVDSALIATELAAAHFWSPEQLQAKTPDIRSDIYSLGVILFLLLADRLPFESQSLGDLIAQKRNSAVPQLPDHLQAFQFAINRMLAADPAERYQTAAECLADIGAIPASTIAAATEGAEQTMMREMAASRDADLPPPVLVDVVSGPSAAFTAHSNTQHDPAIAEELLAARDEDVPFTNETFNSGYLQDGKTRAANTPVKKQREGTSWWLWIVAVICVLAPAVYYGVNYPATAEPEVAVATVVRDIPPVISEETARRMALVPREPSLEEQAIAMRARLDEDFHVATDLVVIYRAILRSENGAEHAFAKEGLAELQEFFAQKIAQHTTNKDVVAADAVRNEAQQLFTPDELSPELAQALRPAQ